MTFRHDPIATRRIGVSLAATTLLAFTFIYFFNHLTEHGLYWTDTGSLPRGLYQRVPDNTSSYIMFCPTGLASTVSAERGYRPRGVCPDKFTPLLKPVVARAGDTVTVKETGIWVNGTRLPKSQQYRIDGNRRTMPHYPAGDYVVAPGTVWVISSYSSASFDSRYYGPVQLSEVIHYVKPYLTF